MLYWQIGCDILTRQQQGWGASQKSMLGKEKRTWILDTRGTAWTLASPSKTIATSEDDSEILKQRIKDIEHSKITVLEINYPNLVLAVTFNNECNLLLLPKAKEDSDLPYWEIFTPSQMMLKVGPGALWSYTRSDTPLRTAN